MASLGEKVILLETKRIVLILKGNMILVKFFLFDFNLLTQVFTNLYQRG